MVENNKKEKKKEWKKDFTIHENNTKCIQINVIKRRKLKKNPTVVNIANE